MKISLIGLVISIFGLTACGIVGNNKGGKRGRGGPKDPLGPLITKVLPSDEKKFDKIFGLPADEIHDSEVEFLKDKNHKITWYNGPLTKLATHDTVQVIYFGSAERVIGWCSGAFLAANRITTAGHCHSHNYKFDLAIGKSCRGKVVFAIRESTADEVTYYECDQLTASEFSKPKNSQEPGSLKDYAVFSLKKQRPKDTNYPLEIYFENADLQKTAKNFTTDHVGKQAVGVFVDPPQKYDDYSSSYDIVPGQILAKAFQIEATYIEPKGNYSQSGNSGGPFYVIEDATIDLKTTPLETNKLSYLAPNYGRFWGNTLLGEYMTLSVVSNPAVIAEGLLSGFSD